MNKTLTRLVILSVVTLFACTHMAKAENPFEKIFTDGLLNAEGEKISLDTLTNKVVGIYFSAHWCGPCRLFTPKLVSYRNQNKDDFEVVFVSSDRTADAQKKYMKEAGMEWATVPFRAPSGQLLSQKHNVQGIPKLVLLHPDGKTLTEDGRTLIDQKMPIQSLKGAKLIEEKYLCGSCSQYHVRKKLIMPAPGK